MVALVRLTANRYVMGEFANTRLTNAVAVTATVFVSALNAVLLLGIVGVCIPLSGG
jgi:manganese transport protein